ncbi:type I-A CRISPR-associated protein Cas7/Csa2 [Saccharolobus caldissimus]|uniref:Type I-A CRISPR-associated protein Cas7/Csa2 n=1 Tax=Saccharolobus caldissimus TaxID=1702097 RepID=A0AAQ4CRV4_9CREN|nr:type I-A CRISPR-associated protein Cas7/Csa2 [Saccharolobus caldissimus]BDB98535.1 type I-A CRISPR-associated protein Cas7/Csa2 [Saccharolobus caldissimus]
MWLSFSVRYLVNVEDLNNVESAGNYVRHRRAPIVFKDKGGYTVTYVPAISGEMIAHGYQMNLVELALQSNLPVESLAKQGILLKRGAGDKVHDTKCGDKKGSDYELCVIEEDIVEDVAGFMNPEKLVKRASNIAFSYMIPALDSVKTAAVLSQFHVRYASKELIDKYKNENIQSLYNVETASASYVLTGYLNLDGIGRTQNYPVKDVKDRDKRVKVAKNALMLTLTQFLFGAKQTRFKPIVEIEGLVVSVSEKPFNLPPLNGDMNEYMSSVSSTADSFAQVLGIKKPTIVAYLKYGKGNVSNPVEVFNNI